MAPITFENRSGETGAVEPAWLPGEPAPPPVPAPAVNPILDLRPSWLRGDNTFDVDLEVRMHPLTLRFDDKELEREFGDEYFARTLSQVRLALVLGFALYTGYGFVDFWLAREQVAWIWAIRYLIVGPTVLGCLWFSYKPRFRQYRELALSVVVIVATLGVVGMTSIIPQPISSLYDVGFFMVLVYAFTLVRLPVPYALAIAAFNLVVYPVSTVLVHETPPAVVASNFFFLLGMVILGFFSNYSMGRYSRSHFLQKRLISLRTEELERKNSELILKNHLLAESRAENVRTARRTEQIFSALSEALPGHVLDEKYRIGVKIGSGGFGTVYKGEHILLHHPVAIKVFRPAVGREGVDSMERFRLEGISACRVNHPNAVTVLDFDVSAGSLAYLVMELLEGYSLAQQLRADVKLSQMRATEIACCVCDALTQAHGAGIVHRDIKPSNVFLHGAEQTVKVIDFGIAKLTDESQAPDAQTTTLSGMFLGTPAYMAPERVFNQPYDGRADVYSVGVMIYEMVAGRLPFERTTGGHVALMRMHAMEKPIALTKVVPDAHPKLEVAVMSAMRREPEERPTAAQLGSMLRELLVEYRGPSRNRRASDQFRA